MTSIVVNRPTLADPYVASSLLQKAIRRGEAELAIEAAHSLIRSRGKSVWRRLVVVAFEDIGIGDLEAIRLAVRHAESHLAGLTSSLFEGLEETISSLSKSAKSRSTDHLVCAAIHRLNLCGQGDTAEFEVGEVLELVGNPSRSIVERTSILLNCNGRSKARETRLLLERANGLRAIFSGMALEALELSLRGFAILKGSFVLTLPLLVAQYDETENSHETSQEAVPQFDWFGRVPSYAFDKHTSVGKRALKRFALENADVRAVLIEYVPLANHVDAVCMAAFHIDAVPLDRKLVWQGADELERAGLVADMAKAGCPRCGINELIAAVSDNLGELNSFRAELFGWSDS